MYGHSISESDPGEEARITLTGVGYAVDAKGHIAGASAVQPNDIKIRLGTPDACLRMVIDTVSGNDNQIEFRHHGPDAEDSTPSAGGVQLSLDQFGHVRSISATGDGSGADGGFDIGVGGRFAYSNTGSGSGTVLLIDSRDWRGRWVCSSIAHETDLDAAVAGSAWTTMSAGDGEWVPENLSSDMALGNPGGSTPHFIVSSVNGKLYMLPGVTEEIAYIAFAGAQELTNDDSYDISDLVALPT